MKGLAGKLKPTSFQSHDYLTITHDFKPIKYSYSRGDAENAEKFNGTDLLRELRVSA